MFFVKRQFYIRFENQKLYDLDVQTIITKYGFRKNKMFETKFHYFVENVYPACTCK